MAGGGGLLRRALLWVAPTSAAALSLSAYVNRPVYFDEPEAPPRITSGDLHPNAQVRESHPNKEYLRTGLYSPKTNSESMLLKAAQSLAITSVIALSRFYLEVLNDTKVVGNTENYKRFLELVAAGNSRERGMITVSNHTSVFDDPVLQSSVTKFVHPDHMRWGICKQSICFNNAAASAFVGAGKVFPIKVGAGLEQLAFKSLARRLADRDWVHIFPEAACIQSGSLGRNQFVGCREESKAKQIGVLKWGVGKLAGRIAFGDHDSPPIIIPYYHVGMHRLKPQKNLPGDNKLVDPWYIPGRVGKQVRVYFGPPIDIDDLVREYESVTKQKRRIARVQGEDDTFADWEGSTKEELEFYSKVARRVEEALLKLEEEARASGDTTD